jgi:hypothetical protein
MLKIFKYEVYMATPAISLFHNRQGASSNSDSALVDAIKQIFRTEGTESTRQAIAGEAPSGSVVSYALNSFNLIQNPAAKMDAFVSVLGASNTTDAIARGFYEALPGDMKDQFKSHIYEQNGGNNEGHGFEFGDYVVENKILGNLSIQAARHYRDKLRS